MNYQEIITNQAATIKELQQEIANLKNYSNYDYYQAVKDDIINHINSDVELSDYNDMDDFKQSLYDDLFVSDSVTGNASGSYTFSTWTAQQYVINNMDLLQEACNEFDNDLSILSRGWEACDVTIRCYLLGQQIDSAIEDLNIEFEEVETC